VLSDAYENETFTLLTVPRYVGHMPGTPVFKVLTHQSNHLAAVPVLRRAGFA
jgi:hypothetical protein